MKKMVFMLFVIPFCASFAHATMNSKFSSQSDFISYERSENLTKGQHSKLKAGFSSKVEENESVVVTLILRNKVFMAIIPQEGSANINSFYIKTGSPAKIIGKDIVVLNSLYDALQKFVDLSILSDKMLIRFIEYLIEFYPVDAYFDNAMTTDMKIDSNEIIEPMIFDSICEEAREGRRLRGEYTIPRFWVSWRGKYCGEDAEVDVQSNGDLHCVEYKTVGPNTEDCMGHCGLGCQYSWTGRANRYTQECFNHDLCTRATGWSIGPCADELRLARDGWSHSDNCDATPTSTTTSIPIESNYILEPTDAPSIVFDSVHFAERYTFTINETATVQIIMQSSFKKYMVLYAGDMPDVQNKIGSYHHPSSIDDIGLNKVLDPGIYCIEFTTKDAQVEGEYNVVTSENVVLIPVPIVYHTVQGTLDDTDGLSPNFDSIHYADWYAFSLDAKSIVQIIMQSSFKKYMVLYAGDMPDVQNKIGSYHHPSSIKDIGFNKVMDPGIYCIEFTTKDANVGGDYNVITSADVVLN